MDNDILNVSIEGLESTVTKIKSKCYEQQLAVTEDFKQIINLLTTENWSSLDNSVFINKMNEFTKFATTIATYYNSIADDLTKIKTDIKFEMNKKDNIHYVL